MADLTVPAAPALVTLPDIELCAVGTWKISTGETTFTYEDLANCVAALDCPGVRNPVLKLGHDEEDGPNVRWDGEPAVGWVDGMHLLNDGAKIAGDFAGMPSWLADILPSAYPDRSVEMYRPFLCQIGHLHPAVIGAVALLGVMPPGVGVLQSLQDVKALYGVEDVAAASRVAGTPAGSGTTGRRSHVPRAAASRTVAVRLGGRLALATASTTVAMSGLRRQPTLVEAAARTDFEQVQADWEDTLAGLLAAWTVITAAQRQALIDQIEEAVDAGTLDQLATLTADSGQAAALLADAMTRMAEDGLAEMAGEADRQGITVPDDLTVDTGRLATVAGTVAELLAAGLAAAAGRRAMQVATPQATGAQVADIVSDHLASLSDTFLRDQLGGALSAAQAAGRFAVLDAAPPAMYAASEVLDANTCGPCAAVDGYVFGSLDDAQAAYANGGYIDCEGFLRCRGIYVAVWDAATATAASTVTALHVEGSRHGHHQGHRVCFVR
jgi:hypothetical protein